MAALSFPLQAFTNLYDLSVERVAFLREGGSLAYLVKGNGQKWLVKLVPPAFAATAANACEILRYLAQKGFPSPRLLPSTDGRSCVPLDAGDGERLCVVTAFIEGREPEQAECAEAVGALAAQLHTAMEGYPGPLVVRDKPFFVGRYLTLLRQMGTPSPLLAAYERLGETLWARVQDLPHGFCHGDFHCGNLLLDAGGTLHLLDFDTACIASPMVDAMVFCVNAIDYFHFTQEGFEAACKVYADFLRGYTALRPLSPKEQEAFYTLAGMYHYQLQATIVEIYGLHCNDECFAARQMEWLRRWFQACEAKGLCASPF